MDSSVQAAVLLLEDQALVALYVEELLQQAGFEHIATYSSCAAAKEWLQENTPKLAIIETRVRDGACDGIAAALAQKGIPFVVHSGECAGRAKMPEKCRWIEKPCDPEEFLEAIKVCSH
ncbi:MAG TPA: response regulator [Pseudorhizobium sp.]|nr:response regulator [Pseudorhizobium sp.]